MTNTNEQNKKHLHNPVKDELTGYLICDRCEQVLYKGSFPKELCDKCSGKKGR